MRGLEPFLIFTRKLNDLGVRYMVSGSVAAMYYGEPRLTNDVDVIVHLRQSDCSRLEEAFSAAEFYCPPLEVVRLEALREQRGHFNLIHHESGFKADVYTAGSDPVHVWGFRNVRQAVIGGEHVALAPPEYVIVRKLQFWKEGGSPKHLRDIRRMIDSGVALQESELQAMIKELKLEPQWEAVLAASDQLL